MVKFRWEKEFRETPIGKIPKDWEVREVREWLEGMVKGKPPKKKGPNGDEIYPYLSVGYLRGSETPDRFYPKEAGIPVDEGEVLIIWDGAANAGEVLKAKKGLLGSTLVWLKTKREVDKRLFYNILKMFEKEIKSLRSGTDDRHVDKEAFLGFILPYPSPDEQKRIATVLSWFDDLIENKRRQNEVLEKTAMAVFKSWFIDFEPFQDEEFVYSEELDMEIPRGWEVGKLVEMGKIIMGQSPPSKAYNLEGDGYPFVQGMGQFGLYVPNTDTYSKVVTKLSKPYDVLITVRAPIGELNIADRCYVLGRGVSAIRSEFWPFVYLYLKVFNESLKSYERGTTFEAVTKSELENFPILIPPKPILEKFHSLVEPLFRKIIINEKEIMVLKKARDTLLPQLVFGRLRVVEL